MTAEAAGLSHSEIAGSRVICTYPALIAAYRVLHRLREPRHPPCALTLFSHNSEDTIRRPNIGKTEEWQQDGVTLILILCLFCRSMSKNDSPYGEGGEYRGRTDDLLHAMQAL